MSRQKSLVEERYSEPSSAVTTSFMRDMVEGVGGVEVQATVSRFCHVLLARIDGLIVGKDVEALSLSLCQSDTTRAYLVSTDAILGAALSPDDWELARLSGIEDSWQALQGEETGLCFLCVSVCEVPETVLEAETAFRLPTQKDGTVYHTAKTDSVIALFRTRGLPRLPRPEMESPFVDDPWVVLTALLSASKEGRQFHLHPKIFSDTFHLTDEGDVVSEITTEFNASLSVLSPVDEAGLRELAADARAIHEAMESRAADEGPSGRHKEGSLGSLIEALHGEHIYSNEDVTRLRYLRLWQALVDASGQSKLDSVGVLAGHERKVLDNQRNRIAHPSRLRISSQRALEKLRSAALAWMRGLV